MGVVTLQLCEIRTLWQSVVKTHSVINECPILITNILRQTGEGRWEHKEISIEFEKQCKKSASGFKLKFGVTTHGRLRIGECKRNIMSTRHTTVLSRRQLNTMRPRRNRGHLADDIFKCIFLNKNVLYWLEIHWDLIPRVQLTIFQRWFG